MFGGWRGRYEQVKTYKAGDFFGELALLSGGLRAATVRAVGPVRCLRLGREPFQEVVHHNKLVRDMCEAARRDYGACRWWTR